jgi:hypothetical protein
MVWKNQSTKHDPIYKRIVDGHGSGRTLDFTPIDIPLFIQVPYERSELLYLTNIRSFQQKDEFDRREIQEKIRKKKEEMKGKQFITHTEAPWFCQRYKLISIPTKNGFIQQIKFTHQHCGSWTCPDCQMKKALSVKYLLREIIVLNNLDRFLTLTLKPSKIPDEYKDDTHQYITKLFNHFITVLKRKRFKYFKKSKNKFMYFELKHSGEKPSRYFGTSS